MPLDGEKSTLQVGRWVRYTLVWGPLGYNWIVIVGSPTISVTRHDKYKKSLW